MTKADITKAKKLLATHIERSEIMSTDTGGLCLSVQWIGGGQRIFYSLDAVEERLDIEEAVGQYTHESFCGYDRNDHDWESRGVWSRVGTAYEEREQCRKCGLIRDIVEGWGPGQDDSVTYDATELKA